MTLAILATGDEIIHGDTLNTNGHEIAKALSSDGVPLGLQLSCSDKEDEMMACIEFLMRHHDIIISIGGLGPTTDDRTRFAFARFLALPLVEFPEAIQHIQARLTRANLPFDKGNRLQALFPKDATLLKNPHGTAMGCQFMAHNKRIFWLPGPPRECLPMFNDYVLPALQQTTHSQKQILSWQLFGVAEGQVGSLLEEALAAVPCDTGYRLDTPYLEFKVRCAPDKVRLVKEKVDSLVASFIISPPKHKASQMLRERLNTMGDAVFITDRATGGVLETLLRCPKNAERVRFYDEPTAVGFHFEVSGLDVYWDAVENESTGELMLTYQGFGQDGCERHSVPYRGHALVLHYAAEWLSFRLLQLIDFIHQGVR
jgi:nicotinamide-nucleotide amidase